MTVEVMIEKLMLVLQSVKEVQMFSPNENVKEVHTEKLKYILGYVDCFCCLIGWDGFTAEFRNLDSKLFRLKKISWLLS